MLTKYIWTVYCCGQLYDVMTDEEVGVLLRTQVAVRMDLEKYVVEF